MGAKIPPLVASRNPREQINTSTLSYPPCNLSPSSLTFVFSLALGLVVWRRGERMRLAYVDVYVPLRDDQSPNCDWDAHGDAVVKNKGPVGVIYVRVKSL